jgi:hypothetical protein
MLRVVLAQAAWTRPRMSSGGSVLGPSPKSLANGMEVDTLIFKQKSAIVSATDPHCK